MKNDRDKMIAMLRRVETVQIDEVFFAELTPKPPMGANVLPYPRISIPLTGQKFMIFAEGGRVREEPVLPGQCVFCPPYCWSKIRWHLDYEMVGLVFLYDYLRVLYADQRDQSPRLAPDVFFHTNQPANKGAQHLLGALEVMAENRSLRASAPQVVQILVQLAVADLEMSDGQDLGKAVHTWRLLAGYVHENYRSPITRNELAEAFELHPAYISRLFKQVTGNTFQDYLERFRMELARKLLAQGTSTVSEVAARCGYSSSSYFIRIFRKHFSTTPRDFQVYHVTKRSVAKGRLSANRSVMP